MLVSKPTTGAVLIHVLRGELLLDWPDLGHVPTSGAGRCLTSSET